MTACTTLIYLRSGEICAGSRHVLPAGSGRLPPATDVIKIYPTLERREILLPEHIVFITVIYYLYIVYVIAALWLMDGWRGLRLLTYFRRGNHLFISSCEIRVISTAGFPSTEEMGVGQF